MKEISNDRQVHQGRTYRCVDGSVFTQEKPSDGTNIPWKGSDAIWRTDSGRAYGAEGLEAIAAITVALPYGHVRLIDGTVVDLTANRIPHGLIEPKGWK